MEIKNSPYIFEGKFVPRVTDIISQMLHEEYLMGWANFMGRVKHMDHKLFTEEAANIGTAVHYAIENYTQKGIIPTFDIEDDPDRLSKMHNCFTAFTKWWEVINTHDIHILMQEETLICKYYGGTLDMLLEIDGKIYLIDFKTSNHFNYKYHVQTAAYRRMLWTERGILIDGIIILRLSKTDTSFFEQIIDLDTYEGLNYITQCEQLFMSILYGYYCRHLVEAGFKSF